MTDNHTDDAERGDTDRWECPRCGWQTDGDYEKPPFCGECPEEKYGQGVVEMRKVNADSDQ